MGYVELNDGTANRRIWVPELGATVQIDLAAGDEPAVTVPERVRVRRTPPR